MNKAHFHALFLYFCILAPVLDWFEESKGEVQHLKSENQRLSNSLIVAEAERDFLIKRREELMETHSQFRKETQRSRAQQRWVVARYKTQTEELIKKLKARCFASLLLHF